MMVNHPRTVAYRWMASTALVSPCKCREPHLDLTVLWQLAAFPWIVSLPFLVATLVIAVRDPSTIARTSAAYCAFTYPEVYARLFAPVYAHRSDNIFQHE
jgi:hypothetical protein